MPERRQGGRRSTDAKLDNHDTRGKDDVQPNPAHMAPPPTEPEKPRPEVEPDRRHPLHRKIGKKRS